MSIALRALRKRRVMLLTDMTDTIEMLLLILMERDGNITVITLGDQSTIITEHTGSISLFIGDDQHLLSLTEHLTYTTVCQD